MSDHFRHVYQHQADAYQQMIAQEDVDNHLLPALQEIVTLEGKRVVDLGSGTGRFPLLWAGQQLAALTAVDLHEGMLREQQRQRQRLGGNWRLIQADVRALPLANDITDVVVVGWALGHFQAWFAPDWQAQISLAVSEMERITAAGGTLIICETMGTGTDGPGAPHAGLAAYYAFLEEQWGFQRRVISTDLMFESVDAAVAHTSFFFPHLVEKIRQKQWQRIPEWTGLWYRYLS